MLCSVEIGSTYISKNSGVKFRVLGFCKHAQDCSMRMIRYINLTPTFDSDAGEEWVVAESWFLRRFEEDNG